MAQMPAFNVIFLGLGWPWVGEFDGFITIFTCFPTQHNLVYIARVRQVKTAHSGHFSGRYYSRCAWAPKGCEVCPVRTARLQDSVQRRTYILRDITAEARVGRVSLCMRYYAVEGVGGRSTCISPLPRGLNCRGQGTCRSFAFVCCSYMHSSQIKVYNIEEYFLLSYPRRGSRVRRVVCPQPPRRLDHHGLHLKPRHMCFRGRRTTIGSWCCFIFCW